MSAGGDSGRPYDFGRARVAGGLFLIGLAGVLTILDAVRPDYNLDTIQLSFMLGTGGVLLGVDALRRLIGG